MKTTNHLKNLAQITLKPVPVLLLLCGLALAVIGCSAFKNGAPPTPAEQKFFNVDTNFLPVVQRITNYQVVTVQQTNVVPVTQVVTNQQNLTVTNTTYATNVVPVMVTNPVVAQVTNEVPQYTYHAGAGVQQAQEIGGVVGNLFGVGGLVSSGIAGLAAVWGWIRSSKQYNAGATLAQGIQTLRSFVQAMPNGAVYDSALTQWLSQHQKDTGAVNEVLTYLEKEVDNQDAKIGAAQIIAAIQALNPQALPPTVVPPKPV